MAVLAPALSVAFNGFYLSLWSVALTIQSRAVLSCYLKFAIRLITIIVVSYIVLSASYITLFCLIVFAVSGPFFPVVIFLLGPLAVLSIAILLFFGVVPLSFFFTVSGGILAPFLNLPSIAYTVTTIFNPLSADEFLLIGIDIFTLRGANRDKYRSIVQENRPAWTLGLYIALSQFLFDVALRLTVRSLSVVLPRLVQASASIVVGSFLFSSKLVTIWSMRANGLTFLDHAALCFSNAPLFVGFGMPFELLRLFIEEYSGVQRLRFVWLIINLGMLYASTASLIDKMPVNRPVPP